MLVGAMGVGKTTLGIALAEDLGRPFLDSDAVILEKVGETGAAIAARDGVEALHQVELAMFVEMAATTPAAVIAPAASVVDSEPGRSILREHITVWLHADDDVVSARLGGGEHRRRTSVAERQGLEARRRPYFAEVSRFAFDTSRPVVQLIPDLVGRLAESES